MKHKKREKMDKLNSTAVSFVITSSRRVHVEPEYLKKVGGNK